MIHQFTDSQSLNVDSTFLLNDAIGPSSAIEINEQLLNDVYLRNLALGIDTVSSADSSTLVDIASQCPFSGGRAVYKARAYLAMLGDTTIYDDDEICSESEEFRFAENDHQPSKVIVFPNPTEKDCTFGYSLPKDENGELKIFNSYGQLVFQNQLPANSVSYNVNLTTFTVGLYKYIVNSSSTRIGSGKLVLIK